MVAGEAARWPGRSRIVAGRMAGCPPHRKRPAGTWEWRRWCLLSVTLGGAGLTLAFPAGYVGTCIAVAGAVALLGEVFRCNESPRDHPAARRAPVPGRCPRRGAQVARSHWNGFFYPLHTRPSTWL